MFIDNIFLSACRRTLCRFAALAAVAVLAVIMPAACVFEDSDMPVTPPAVTGDDGQLRFSVENALSRMSTDMYSSAFDDGDKIGCVIARKNADGSFTYLANSEWTYKAAHEVLVLENVWGANGKTDAAENSNNILTRNLGNGKFTKDDGFLTLRNTSADYAFFFYYPYIDDSMIQTELQTLSSGSDFTSLNLPWNYGDTSYTTANGWPGNMFQDANKFVMIGQVDSQTTTAGNKTSDNPLSGTFPHFSWLEYPCFVSTDQNGGNADKRANFSDHLWVAYTADSRDNSLNINSTTAKYEVNLVFHKKMAAVVVIGDKPLTNVSFKGFETEGIKVGVKLNLQTGKMRSYLPAVDQNSVTTLERASSSLKNSYHSYYPVNEMVYEHTTLYPRHSSDNMKHTMILPPQQLGVMNMTFTLLEHTYTVDIGSRIYELEENKLYIVRVHKQGDWEIVIRDWMDSDKSLLLEPED